MSQADAAVDHETVYRLLYEERWTELLDLVHRHRDAVAENALLSHAVDVFEETFFERLPEEDPAAMLPKLEKLFLLHAGGYHALRDDHFEAAVEHLVSLHADRPQSAVGYARHCPENAVCADVLQRHDLRRPVKHSMDDRIRLDETHAEAGVDRTKSLFRSRQEEAFFMAVREVFASYFAYPNVALSSLLDFERLKDDLTAAERQYFFRGMVDCVVFDQQDGYRPCYFFELDSPHHDTDPRREKDAMKDRVLALAGRTLYRIRVKDRRVGRKEFARLLKEIVR
ncbi:MAG: DUF2726 domain-containing protein [Rhodothermales bacterium]